jgi:hypothetical protein
MTSTTPKMHNAVEQDAGLITSDRLAACLARGRRERSLAFHAGLAFVVAAVRRAVAGRAADKQPNSLVTR